MQSALDQDNSEYTRQEMDVDGVEDDAANEIGSPITFAISSYGADYTVDSLIKRMNNETFYVPPFQRSFVWTQRQSSRFVESLLLGLPVPGIFVAKEEGSARHLIIDGQQRLKTLQFFFSGKFKERRFRLLDVDPRWESKDIEIISDDDRLRLEDTVIHTTVFKQDHPKNDDTSIYHVFERLNTGSSKLYPQEIRNCVSYGSFSSFLQEANSINEWRQIFGPTNNRLKDQELILRFLALFYGWESYRRPMKDFLNIFMMRNREVDVEKRAEFLNLFRITIKKVHESIGDKAFRPERNLNTAVFDSVMVGLAKSIVSDFAPDQASILSAYKTLLENEEYRSAYIRATAVEQNVNTRIKLAISAFGGS